MEIPFRAAHGGEGTIECASFRNNPANPLRLGVSRGIFRPAIGESAAGSTVTRMIAGRVIAFAVGCLGLGAPLRHLGAPWVAILGSLHLAGARIMSALSRHGRSS
jgi:hypothetical protein